MAKKRKRAKRGSSARPQKISSSELIDAMRTHVNEMEGELAKLRKLRPLLSLASEGLQAMLAIVPYMRRKPGRQYN